MYTEIFDSIIIMHLQCKCLDQKKQREFKLKVNSHIILDEIIIVTVVDARLPMPYGLTHSLLYARQH